MRFLYKVATNAYVLLVRIVSPFNKKANEWVSGRKRQESVLKQVSNDEPLIWFHCASLGEFEQGKPVIDRFKDRNPKWRILITFFSPSGYEVRKEYENVDYVYYLPIESKTNVNLFLSKFNPQIAVFVKYEFWYDYINELYKRSIPLIFISSTFRKEQLFFKPYGAWFLKQLSKIQMFFVQDEESLNLLFQYGVKNVKISGDTRFDRVMSTVDDNDKLPFLEQFKGDSRIIIFGSAWENETEYFLKFVDQIPENWKLIFAPHEINQNRLNSLINQLGIKSIKFSEINKDDAINSKILFVDTVGHLARMYKYADVAFIGGGYDDGIHNILEPLAFGSPVFFGPNHHGFGEGKDSIKYGVGYEILKYQEFETQINYWVGNTKALDGVQYECKNYVREREGATQIVLKYLNEIV